VKHLNFGTSKRIAAASLGAIAVTSLLAMSMPAASASSTSLLGLTDDQPATTHCDKTITGVNNAVINVAAPSTYCLVNLQQIGAVNVAPGAALSITGGSIINGAITLVAAKAFTFCASSTKQGAVKASRSAGFVIIGSGGDGGLLATPCGANHIDGAVTLAGNLGGVEVGGNSIVGALTVSSNIAPLLGVPKEDNATEIEGNTVKGLTTCAGNTPAPVNDGRKNTFTGGAGGQCAGL
jgi:5'-nucleotidase